MAARMSLVRGVWRKFPRRISMVTVSPRQLSTSNTLTNENFRDSETSWVRRILRGSGPSQDIDDSLDEEEIVEVEPQYMDIIQTPKATFIDRPQTRKRNYQPPNDLEERIKDITCEVLQDGSPEDWRHASLTDSDTKYQILMKCFAAFKHDVPNFLLNKMQTMEDIVAFYQTEVKDTTKFDELSAVNLPPNLKIHWNYKDDSKLELYEDYLEYIEPKKSPKPPKWKYMPS